MRKYIREWLDGISPPVFGIAAVFNVSVIVFGAVWTETAGRVFSATLSFITDYFGRYYVVIVAFYHFRHGLPLAPRSLLYPLVGDRIHGWAT